MPRRTTKPKEEKKQPVFTWAFASSQPHGGQVINYQTSLEETGLIWCNCPGWIFSKAATKDEKTCTHKKQVQGEAADILRKFRRGEPLPVLEDIGAPTRTLPAAAIKGKDASSRIRFGRVIEL